jgi:hypothetical protein
MKCADQNEQRLITETVFEKISGHNAERRTANRTSKAN